MGEIKKLTEEELDQAKKDSNKKIVEDAEGNKVILDRLLG